MSGIEGGLRNPLRRTIDSGGAHCATGTSAVDKSGTPAIFKGLLNDAFLRPAPLPTFEPKLKKEIVG